MRRHIDKTAEVSTSVIRKPDRMSRYRIFLTIVFTSICWLLLDIYLFYFEDIHRKFDAVETDKLPIDIKKPIKRNIDKGIMVDLNRDDDEVHIKQRRAELVHQFLMERMNKSGQQNAAPPPAVVFNVDHDAKPYKIPDGSVNDNHGVNDKEASDVIKTHLKEEAVLQVPVLRNGSNDDMAGAAEKVQCSYNAILLIDNFRNLAAYLTWKTTHKEFISSFSKSRNNTCCSYAKNTPQFCTCHTTNEPSWHDFIIKFKFRAKRIFTRRQLWVHPFVKWVHDLYCTSSRYCDVIVSAIASQITSVSIVYSTVWSVTNQRWHQSSASLAFVVNSPHKGPVTREMFPFDDVIMQYIAVCTMVLYWTMLYRDDIVWTLIIVRSFISKMIINKRQQYLVRDYRLWDIFH